ncbi:MAG: aminopeptidase, partial [Paraprevotella sp.]|nr:aminopeptidase [Paraprevotella sp.]
MKKNLFLLAAALLSLNASAQEQKTESQEKKEGFEFTVVKALPTTAIRNQNQSGTCWCFSSLSFFEAELLRMGKGEHDLCEMFVVHKTMEDRAQAAVRTHGDVSYSQGGSFYDVVYCLQNYGIVPQEAMPQPGTLYGDTLPNHNEVDLVATAFVKALSTSKLKKLSPIWRKAFSSIYDTYLGVCPEKFSYNGKEYTPQEYVKELGLNMDDYVSLTSYTHHPFYKTFSIEVPDNWRWAHSYNLPLDEFMEVFD